MSLIGGWSALVDPLYESSPATLPHTQLLDRKSTRLNSSHSQISYAVFCLKKKTHFLIVLLKEEREIYQRLALLVAFLSYLLRYVAHSDYCWFITCGGMCAELCYHAICVLV